MDKDEELHQFMVQRLKDGHCEKYDKKCYLCPACITPITGQCAFESYLNKCKMWYK